MLADVNTAFPRAAITRADIRLVHRGLLPASEASPRKVTLLRESPFIDHGEDGCANLFSLVGVRYTTARQSAESAVNTLVRRLGLASAPCATATTQVHGGRIDDFAAFLAQARRQSTADVPASLIERLVYSYGTAWQDIVELAREDAQLLRPLGWPQRGHEAVSAASSLSEVTGAEVVYAMREEMAITLADALLRRTDAGARGYPGEAAVQHAVTLMSAELGWSEARQAQERQDLRRTYDAATLRGN